MQRKNAGGKNAGDTVGQAEFEAAVRAQCSHFSSSFARGDIDGLVDGYYTEDPIMIAPAVPLLEGREAVKALFRDMATSGIRGIVLESVHITVEGGIGYEIGRAQVTVIENGVARERAGRYLVTWRRGTDGWRAETDMFGMEPL